MIVPVKGARLPTSGILSYLYDRTETHKHRGIDLPAKKGTPVYAAGAGEVEHANREWRPGFTGYGRVVVIRHDNGTRTLYAHLDRVMVEPGDYLRSGQQLGTVGVTQFSKAGGYVDNVRSGPHLHFEVAPRRYPMGSEAGRLDPVAWLKGGGGAQHPYGDPIPPHREPGEGGWLVLAALGAWVWLTQ